MGRLSQQSYLGDIPGRLQRAMDLDGILPVGLEDGIVPVVIVADGTTPGMSSQRGRRWQFTLRALATGQNVGFSPATNQGRIVVDQLELTVLGGVGGDRISLYQYVPNVTAASPIVPNGNAVCQFVEDYKGDLAPVNVANGAGAATVLPIGTYDFAVAPQTLIVPVEYSLLAPAIMVLQGVLAGAGTFGVTVRGRVF